MPSSTHRQTTRPQLARGLADVRYCALVLLRAEQVGKAATTERLVNDPQRFQERINSAWVL